MNIPDDDESPEDILRELERERAELQQRLADLKAARSDARRRAIKRNTGWFVGGFLAGLFGGPRPQQPSD